jgi:hypothetical protein
MIEKVRNYSEIVKEVNFERRGRPVDPLTPKPLGEPSRRDRMMEFAKRVPRPPLKKPSLTTIDAPHLKQGSHLPKPMEFLENQHLLYQQRLKDLKIS